MDAPAPQPDEQLLRSLAEQLKSPLTLISRQAELNSKDTLGIIDSTARDALRLIDAYLLSGYLHGQQQLQLEPVSLKALLYEVAHELGPLAKKADKSLYLSHKGRFGQVMAHPEALKKSIELLCRTAITGSKNKQILLLAEKQGEKIATGVFSDLNITAEALQKGRELYGRSRQALPSAEAGPGTEIYMAESLLNSMAAKLQVARRADYSGLMTTLLPSQQLTLV